MKLFFNRHNLLILSISLTILLILILSILIIEKRSKRLSKIESQKNIFRLKDHKLIQTIRIYSSSSIITCTKSKDTWQLKQDQISYSPDNTNIRFLAIRLSQLSYESEFPEITQMQSLENFKITSNPWIEFETKSKKFILFKGAKTASKTGYYLKVNTSKSIFVVSITSIQDLKFKLNQLRDKDFFKLNINNIQDVVVQPYYLNRPTLTDNPSYIKRQHGYAEILYQVPETIRNLPEFYELVDYDKNISQIKLKNATLIADKNVYKIKKQLLSLSYNSFYTNAIKTLFNNLDGSHWIIQSPSMKSVPSDDLDLWIFDITNLRAIDFIDAPESKEWMSTIPKLKLRIKKKDKTHIDAQLITINNNSYVQLQNDPVLYKISKVFYNKIINNLAEFYN